MLYARGAVNQRGPFAYQTMAPKRLMNNVKE
jgi:hypothetical protein